jgi:hypothetical protein
VKKGKTLISHTRLAIKNLTVFLILSVTTITMAQTANKKKQQPVIKQYNKISLVKQRLIWLYYDSEQTNNQEGLSPEGVVGGITDWGIAGTAKTT